VAVLTVKGLSILEIAELRNTSSGTVKAQQHSVYQKAGVKSRAELILNCIEEVTDSSPLISN
ncbi:LuxR C-terminal-related transcriptional regulator, partial [Litoricolaceae bacterium]|nr:LuxR C-terminal-related transcriptional regulator [Litorivicinaceae bacterium]